MPPETIELIVYRLDELKAVVGEVRAAQHEQAREMVLLREDVAGLKVKAGIWGAIAGAIPAIVVALYWFWGHK
ncbi:MAG TPA: hypothetical protein VJP78_12760 [Thermoleophilia bacterium]|nr:hypothetical protein [Thermoleophilia bacterium]